MKTLRTRIMSAFLVIMTLLTLLPTSALAASSTGTGIKPTSNTNYWTTRLLHDGTPYSYKPPMAAGKMLYCMDRGYGYRWGTASFLNSYTYTSATGADADAVLKTALAQSGMGELDAQQLENFKWMMTYIVDYKGDIPGSLFMAAQTYVWDHQSFKGEGDGDIDGGGYANADTYEMYLGYTDWMLKEKAKEDAEFQKQIEEYAAKGIIASVVEDEAAKWAVWAKSSVKGRQSFFNYYAPRKLVVNDAPVPDKPTPPAGDADITLRKVAAGTTRGLDGAKFNIYRDGQIVGSDVTKNGGIIEVKDVTKGLWSFVETEAPAGYCADSAPISVYVDTTDGDKQYTVTAENYALPDMKIIKRDAMSGKPIAGTVFSVKSVTGSFSTSVTTGTDGSTTLSAIPAGVYVVREGSVPEPYILSNTEQTVALRPGQTSEVTFVDYEKPGLEIIKKNIANGEPIEGVTYRIEQIDGSYSTTATTDSHGRIFLDSIPVGTYRVTETNVPSYVILCPIPQEVALKAGETSTVTFFNALKPTLEIRKVDSVTGDPVKGAKFQIWYASNHTDSGELNDLGTYYTDESGKIILPEVKDGWYKVTELEAPHGYSIKEPATQECFISGGESKVLTFENTPLSAIIIRKVDSESGQPLEGAWFRIRFLGGTSGTGGTVIGEYRTSSNGTIVVTGLKAGTYVCEEISAPDGYVITDATETVYLSGKDQDVITVTFGNDKMGSLLIVKKDAVTGAPISDVEFLVTDSDGSVIGTANGKYVTDSAGTIRIDGLPPGMTVIAKEVRAKDGYILDDTPQSIRIKRNSVMTLEFRNQPKGGVLVRKVDAVTSAPISDVEFLVTDSDGNFIGNANGKFVTDSAGSFTITDVAPDTTLIIKETRAKDGYILDDTPQSIKIKRNSVMTLEFRNQPKGGVLVKKVDAVTNAPISDVEFLVTDSDGNLIGNANGKFVTDSAGTFTITDIIPDTTLIIKETRTKDGYILDDTPQTVKVKSNEVVTVEFRNQPKGNLIVVKQDSVTKAPLEGVQFKIVYANGSYVDADSGTLSSTGLYWTDKDGKIALSGISGTVVVTEVETIPGYTIDENSRTQTVVVDPNDTQTLYFYNTPAGGLQIIKRDESSGKRISGVRFEVRKVNGEIVGTYTTDSDGVIYLPEIESGWYTVTELKAAPGYLLDTASHRIEVKDGQTATLEITNHKSSRILLHKVDKDTGKGIYGAVFLLYDSNHNPIGEYVTDQDGYIYADDGLADGRYYLREIKAADGYVLDPELKTIYLRYGSTTEIEWTNTPIRGQIQIVKKSADYNPTNGLPAGSLLEGAVFEVYDKAGNVVDTIRTDRNGRASSKLLPLSRYTIREVRAPAFYSANPTVMTAYLDHEGQIVTFEVTNASVNTGVAIKKTGPSEVMPDQPIRYTFSQIGNTSNIALDSFYWRDTLPAQVTVNRLVTGTYNQAQNYKIVYKVNGAGAYRTLADNLSTTKNYVLDMRPAVLGLAANERVTEIMFVFGTVPAGFAQVETPTLYGTVHGSLSNGTSLVNSADIGGLYNGQWVQAVSRWLTTVYTKTTMKLPKTGY